MSFGIRKLLLAAACSAALVGCGGSGSGGDDAPSAVHANSLVVTRSVDSVAAKTNGGSQILSITFTSSDAQAITNLVVDGLGGLPADWTAAPSFGCSTVTTGNSCVLRLTYTPTAGADGSIALTYSYVNSAGEALDGSIATPFAATSDNNVVATVTPSGQVVGIVGTGRNVAIAFSTDDGAAASKLEVTTDLAALPPAWSSQVGNFQCATVELGGTCVLTLNLTSLGSVSGALVLNYQYEDNSGTAKTGVVNIPYITLTSNNIVASASSTSVSATAGGSAQTTVTFTTDDGEPATDFSITSPLPADWSAPTPFTCANVSTGNGCQIALTYQPASAGTGTLGIDYSYTDSAGLAKTGSLGISYSARNPMVYVADSGDVVRFCAIDSGGDLSNCQPISSAMGGDGIAFSGDYAYISSLAAQTVSRCKVDPDGDLSNCIGAAPNLPNPWMMQPLGDHLYIASLDATETLTYCTFSSNGGLVNCVSATGAPPYNSGIALNGQFAYLSFTLNSIVQVCSIDSSTGALSACVDTGSDFFFPQGIALSNGRAYVANYIGVDNITMCQVDSNTGLLSSCMNAAPTLLQSRDIHISDGRAYVSHQSSVSVCDIDSGTGLLQNCRTSTGGATFTTPVQITVH